MATENSNTGIFISQTESGFPDYLDFGKMRTAAIEYLGPITSAYWTDYNEHDPGITTLEALLYALMDLGYRVNWPIVDLLTQPGSGKDMDFFTPAQVLGSNPFTINDYRKKLMDLKEVRNAWLKPVQPTDSSHPVLNGLYEVNLELEQDPMAFGTSGEWDKYSGEAVAAVVRVLQAHRNLCEDFLAPVVMKKKAYSVTADIELNPGVSIPEVYQALIKSLYLFFSPAPTYYTLDQLVAMQVSLAQVFAGRPYSQRPSYGFLLDADLPALPGGDTQSIYSSDVFKAILTVQGIGTVKNLNVFEGTSVPQALSGGVPQVSVLQLDSQTLPVFSVAGSGFRWFHNGQQLSWSPSTPAAQLQRSLAYSGKVLYLPDPVDASGAPVPSQLDLPVPKGQYLAGLGTYYSIQNDFPEVYGIGPGGLPPSASLQRQAQALQFKGYLLFFEQLMADFLKLLENIRQFLSLSAAGAATAADPDEHGEDITGWGPDIDTPPRSGGGGGNFSSGHGDLSDVPGLDQLLQFPAVGGGGLAGGGGSTGSGVLAIPVDARKWQELIDRQELSVDAVDKLQPFGFESWHERDLAVAELVLSFGYMPPTVQTCALPCGKAEVTFFVISGIRRDFVLLSGSMYSTLTDASSAGQLALYSGASKDYYTLSDLRKEDGKINYTFSLGQSKLGYYDYVDQLLTNPQQTVQQRTSFLLHLVDRFGENFTDYAKLTAGFLSPSEIATKQVGLMQRFLTRLPQLGADRGRAYDYTRSSWDRTNTSGMELRFKAYSGIGDWRRHYLCPFEVVRAERRYRLKAVMGDETVMTGAGGFTEAEAYVAAGDLYRRMKSGEAGKKLKRMLRLAPADEDILPDEREYQAEVVRKSDGAVVRRGVAKHKDVATGTEDAEKKIHDLHLEKYWEIVNGRKNDPGTLERSREKDSHLYLDRKEIEMPIKHDIPHKPEHSRIVVSSESGSFSFDGRAHYRDDAGGREASREFLFLLLVAGNYVTERVSGGALLAIRSGGEIVAVEKGAYADEEAARRKRDHIIRWLEERLYVLRMAPTIVNWKFQFYLGLPGTRDYLFRSSERYGTKEKALEAAGIFFRSDKGWQVSKDKGGWVLEKSGGGMGSAGCVLEEKQEDDAGAVAVEDAAVQPGGLSETSEGASEKELQQLVKAKSSVLALEEGNREALGSWVLPDERFPADGYVYRLVDKDRPRAFHPLAEGDAGDTGRQAAEAARTTLVTRGWRGYVFPEISRGGDVVFSKLDDCGKQVYHYRIRVTNDYFSRRGLPGEEKAWTLFESIAAYPTEDAASQAFEEQWLYVLEKAMVHRNYGEQDFIAWDEHGKRLAVVYVAREIREALERNGRNVADELVKAAGSCPIRMTGWEKRMADDEERRTAGYQPLTITAEEAKNKTARYFFQLEDEEGRPDWTSAGVFASMQDVHIAFDYFRLLLQESRNYFIEYDETACRYRVGIREVLVESTGSFTSEPEAWGKEGVQRFIGAAQTAGGWHPETQDYCCWGYFVACPNELAAHPCGYETARQRDAALEALQDAPARGFPKGDWMSGGPAGLQVLEPTEGKPVASIAGVAGGAGTAPDEAGLNLVMDMLDAAWAGLFYEDEEGVYVKAGAGNTLVRPVGTGAGRDKRDKWECALLCYGAYFPIVRTSVTGSAAQYRVEIKLPGFAALPGKLSQDKDCGCGRAWPAAGSDKAASCYAAWVSPSSYDSAMEAWSVYEAVLLLLADSKNYQAVQDETGISFGIELLVKDRILARSVQSYYHAQMAARGMRRGNALVNMEGLNVVEHLLLRKEMGATKAIGVCGPGENPTLKTDTAGTIFQPGGDGYSFIITVFLPAWPQRFRKQENRQLLESIVQRETPAHILPRILWLTPMDMCRMEESYKRWLNWLKTAKHCGDFNPDELVELLFGTQLDCMWDLPCGKESQQETSDEWLSEINKLYCWADTACANTSGWTSGGGTPATQGKQTFVMSGTELVRPALKKPIPEKKPEKKRERDHRETQPHAVPPKDSNDRVQPNQRSENAAEERQGPLRETGGDTRPETFWQKARGALENVGGEIATGVGKLFEWGGNLIKRIRGKK